MFLKYALNSYNSDFILLTNVVPVPFDRTYKRVLITCSEPAGEALKQSLIVSVHLSSAARQTTCKPQYANYVGVSPARLHVVPVPAPEQEPFQARSSCARAHFKEFEMKSHRALESSPCRKTACRLSAVPPSTLSVCLRPCRRGSPRCCGPLSSHGTDAWASSRPR